MGSRVQNVAGLGFKKIDVRELGVFETFLLKTIKNSMLRGGGGHKKKRSNQLLQMSS